MHRIALCMAISLVAGCASVAGEKTQPLTVQAVFDNKEVAGVGCTLANDAGKWFVTTPSSVMVHKSTGDLTIDCAKDKTIVGHETAISKSNGAVWGNILIGGGIGYIVDRNTGAGFDYPSVITVVLHRVGEILGVESAASIAPTSANVSAVPSPTAGTAATKQTAQVVPPPVPATAVLIPTVYGSTAPAEPKAVQPAVGQDSTQIERMGRDKGCDGKAAAVLTGKGPGYDLYTYQCTVQDIWSVRCEYGQCRTLR